MSNPLYQYQQMNQAGNPLQMLNQLRQNPAQFLKQMGVNIPTNLNDPNSIIQYLMNSGQVSQQRYEQARRLAEQFCNRK